MVVLRCTQKLLVRLKQVGDLPPVESTTRLGDWYGNILRIGRRLLPAGPPAEERMGGREGRERPGLPHIWVGTGPASRVAHAPCPCPDRPEKRGPDRAQIGAQFRGQMHVTIALAVALAINLA